MCLEENKKRHFVDFGLIEGNEKQTIHSFPTPTPGKELNYSESEVRLSLCYSKHNTLIFIFFKQKSTIVWHPSKVLHTFFDHSIFAVAFSKRL